MRSAQEERTDKHVGERIRHRRWMIRLTQQHLAEKVGIKFQQIQKYESGVNRVGASRLWAIAQAMDVPVEWFFEGLDDEAAEKPGQPYDDEDVRLAVAIRQLPGDVRAKIRGLIEAMSG